MLQIVFFCSQMPAFMSDSNNKESEVYFEFFCMKKNRKRWLLNNS